MPVSKNDKRIHADSKHAKIHGKSLVEEESYLHLDKDHKDWYNRRELGKQRGKPKYVPLTEKKPKKSWKQK